MKLFPFGGNVCAEKRIRGSFITVRLQYGET